MTLPEALALIPSDFYLLICTAPPPSLALHATLYQRGVEQPAAGVEAPSGFVETFEARIIAMLEQRFVGVDACEILSTQKGH